MKAIAAALCAAIALAACSGSSANRSTATPSPTAAPYFLYPTGIIAPTTWSDAVHQGIYPAYTRDQCCFLRGRAQFVLDLSTAAQLVILTFYVPNVEPLRGGRERATISLGGVAAASVALQTGIQDVTVTIPREVRGKPRLAASILFPVTWIPKSIGMGADVRRLSVMLVKVGYI